ncbi:hypothetical protein BGZ70_007079, partial [Mortierella alpina]
MIMTYIPPPANNASQIGSSPEALGHSTTPSPATLSSHHPPLRPVSAAAAMSSSFNTFSSGSQPVQKPAMLQGARSSYIGSSTPIASSNGAGTQSKTSFSPMNSETPASSSSRFARRGPLVMSQDNSSFAEDVDSGMNSGGAKSRRQSAAYSDAESPAQHQYIQSVQGLQPFSPASQRTETGSSLLPGAAGTQLQVAKEGWLWRRGNLLTWKRCYAMGRYRGDTQPGIFTLFKDNEHLFPIKTIDMSECFEVQVKAQDAKGSGRFEFKVVTRKEETWFATDTMSERTGWIDALNSLMAKIVGASLMKLEQKLNNIRHRNHSLEYAHTSLPVEKASMEGHLQLVQHDLAVREQQLSQRELDLEKKRVESLLVQLEAWRAAAKVTVNQHYSVRDQLLERVMKAARTFQELQERAKIHLETGSDQVIEVVSSHLDCLKVHASEDTMSPASFRMLKSILVGLTVNLDTRSSEIKRVLLVMEQYISATKAAAATPRTSSLSSPSSPILAGSHTSGRERRISVAEPPYHTKTPSPTPTIMGMSVYLIQIKEKYTATLEILEEHSRQMKRVLERVDVQSADHVRKFHEEAREVLRSLLNLPTYAFTPCIPDQPLPGAPDTFYREDLVQLQQQSQEILRRGHSLNGQSASAPAAQVQDKSQDAALRDGGASRTTTGARTPEYSDAPTAACETAVKPQPRASTPSSSSGPPTLPLALPPSLSSFLLPDKNVFGASTADLTQRLRDTILPEFDHLSIKHEESTQAMTLLLNQISSQLVNKLAEIKDATASQRQEFEELKDEIIDVMQLSATDPSAPQRDISTLSEIRSKLAEITEQLTKVQSAQNQAGGATYLGAGSSMQVVSKLDQLLLLLEFVNTAQCRMMAYQDLEFDRGLKGGYGTSNVDDGRMMAVQEHMEQLDRKMGLQMHLLRRLVTLQGSEPLSDTSIGLKEAQGVDDAGGARLQELSEEDAQADFALSTETEEGRIQELADQLSEMKRQLDEQQRRQEDHQLQSGGTLKTRVSSPSSADRSRSSERPVTPLLHSRSPSQPLGLLSNSANPLSSPLETENPAFWRASLRPSASNGSSYSGSVRERAGVQSTSGLPNATTSSVQGSHGGGSNAQEASAAALASNPPSGPWSHSLHHQTSFGSSSSLITKTSDRIAEMLERMDARMSQVIDEQLARYEKGNKELLAKVYDLLDADDDENEDDDEDGDVAVQAKVRTRQHSSPRQGTTCSPLLMGTTAPCSEAEMQQEQHQIADVKELLEKVLRGQDDLLRTSWSSDRIDRQQHEVVKSSEEDDGHRRQEKAAGETVGGSSHSEELSISLEVSESLDKIKALIQQEGDRSEATLNEQRDEVLEKMHHL